MNQPLDKTLDNFMSQTAKSTVAVIVPLFGYWGDIPNNPVNGEVLKVAMSRLYSNVHHLYLIFVAHPQSLPHDANDPDSVANILLGIQKRGNTINIPVSREATYAEYINVGIEAALNETKAQFVMCFNPWVMIQDGSVDVIIDRCNRADDAKVISGFDLRSITDPENFDLYRNSMPVEERDLSFDFLAMPRYVAEMISLDPTYKTHVFLQRDLWQQIRQKNFDAITSQRVPIFPFDFPWQDYEDKATFELDRAYFSKKWLFDPGISYLDMRGVMRKDKSGAR